MRVCKKVKDGAAKKQSKSRTPMSVADPFFEFVQLVCNNPEYVNCKKSHFGDSALTQR
jgi:hypothetical protein